MSEKKMKLVLVLIEKDPWWRANTIADITDTWAELADTLLTGKLSNEVNQCSPHHTWSETHNWLECISTNSARNGIPRNQVNEFSSGKGNSLQWIQWGGSCKNLCGVSEKLQSLELYRRYPSSVESDNRLKDWWWSLSLWSPFWSCPMC